jgi:3-dehydroquinate synthase II/3-amino-4-hydroxybenzoic acid synthase
VNEPTDLIPIWCDVRHLGTAVAASLGQVLQTPATGVLLTAEQVPEQALPDRVRLAVLVEDETQLAALDPDLAMTVVLRDPALLGRLAGTRWSSGLWVDVVDAETMRLAVASLDRADVLIVSFRDETNIPLELVIAEVQSRRGIVVKQVRSVNDALVTRGVLQHGPHAMLLPVTTPHDVAAIAEAYVASRMDRVTLVEAEVTESRSIGMGMRGCVDTTALFEPDEGILVGSTSAGGLLVCAEVHHLPYMNLRPFRVNAGAVHSYVWTPGNRTAYVTDLCAGEPVLAVSTTGDTRPMLTGRVKIEMRPLRLIVCRVDDAARGGAAPDGTNRDGTNRDGTSLNVIVQDDWHVRLFDAAGTARNCTSLRPGDRMLALTATPGRHVGIAVAETISEV